MQKAGFLITRLILSESVLLLLALTFSQEGFALLLTRDFITQSFRSKLYTRIEINQRTNGPVKNDHLISGPSISTKYTKPGYKWPNYFFCTCKIAF